MNELTVLCAKIEFGSPSALIYSDSKELIFIGLLSVYIAAFIRISSSDALADKKSFLDEMMLILSIVGSCYNVFNSTFGLSRCEIGGFSDSSFSSCLRFLEFLET